MMNSGNLRVAMLSVHTCPLAMLGGKKTGGMNVYVRDLSRALGLMGIDVDVFTRSQDDCVPMVNHDLGERARVIHVPAGPQAPIPVADVGHYLDEFAAGVAAFAAAEGLHYDVIHSHYWLSGVVAEKLEAYWGETPIVHMFHTLGHMKNRIATEPGERAPQERLDGESHVMTVADRLIAATPAELAQLNWLYGAPMDKVIVIPPGVDLQRFQPIPSTEAKNRVGIPCGDKNIMFAGRIEPLKGIDTLIQAMALIRQRYPDVMENTCVAIIGGDPWADNPDAEMARLQALREELGINDLVLFLGAKDQDVLPNYYAAAEMVVMPSHYESFGMVALEAMAMGRPVIASEVGGLAYLVQDGVNGYHVPTRDPEALAERIYELLTNVDCREAMGIAARQYAERFDWAIIAGRILAVYNRLLDPLTRDHSPALLDTQFTI
ncbi:D-inositol 3-phosphate glycosyltransferase 2 [Candidatus Promineifilum breve]|uniref:D-inositol 3-phosphate glycosyltransferase 2 n=1 Tax=Candidatus Promineifilum breve TaxID=1806508 RepID=A0A160T0C8_9CHLR|nr:glycosyltransferase [Candidatus Promineifilum breve]CUS02148.2 D-inositol 3-phosphate glycosyltransferase 2 [Candidatus Promineifilum breve]